jgi:hypothetical protein
MPKDKLMQAAGRLRQLGRGQTLLLMGLPDISSKIAAAAGARSSVTKQAAFGITNLIRRAAQTASTPASTAAGPPDMRAVLSWVMANTVEATLSGIAEAAHQGMQFAATYGGAPQGCVVPERLSVEELYGSRKVQEPLPQLLQVVAEHYTAHPAMHVTPAGDSSSSTGASTKSTGVRSSSSSSSAPRDNMTAVTSIRGVLRRFSGLGQGHAVLAGQGTDEECERELEQEEEEETEREVQVPAATAAAENSWDWRSALTASSPCRLQQAGCQMVQLPQGVQQIGAEGGVGEVGWCGKVWVSHNFLHSISGSPVSPGLRDYLRPVGALLVFSASREVLLLSEREADAVQSEVWSTAAAASKLHAAAGSPNVLVSLPYLRLACTDASTAGSHMAVAATTEAAGPNGGQQQLFLASPNRGGVAAVPTTGQLAALVPVEVLVSVQLFAGAVMYGSTDQRELLHGLVSGRREAAQELLAWRGRLHLLARSDLDRACNDHLC